MGERVLGRDVGRKKMCEDAKKESAQVSAMRRVRRENTGRAGREYHG